MPAQSRRYRQGWPSLGLKTYRTAVPYQFESISFMTTQATLSMKADLSSAIIVDEMVKKPPSKADQEIGARIRQLREDFLDLTQEKFAARIGVTRGAVGNWELGKGIKRENLLRIHKTFGASFEWLSVGSGDAMPPNRSTRGLLPLDDDAMDAIDRQVDDYRQFLIDKALGQRGKGQ